MVFAGMSGMTRRKTPPEEIAEALLELNCLVYMFTSWEPAGANDRHRNPGRVAQAAGRNDWGIFGRHSPLSAKTSRNSKEQTMFIKTFTTSLAFALAAGAALAQGIPAGEVQLAASAGVAPGVYSSAQMVQLIEARRDGDADRVSFILAQGTSTSRADFAASSPVTSASGRSAADLVLLNEARRENDAQAVAFILSGGARSTGSDASIVTPGEAQLAAIVGVDPADYTLSELTAMQPQP